MRPMTKKRAFLGLAGLVSLAVTVYLGLWLWTVILMFATWLVLEA
jgi:hypothetical protein